MRLFVPQSDGYVCSVVSPLGGGAGGGKGSVSEYVSGENTSHGITSQKVYLVKTPATACRMLPSDHIRYQVVTTKRCLFSTG